MSHLTSSRCKFSEFQLSEIQNWKEAMSNLAHFFTEDNRIPKPNEPIIRCNVNIVIRKKKQLVNNCRTRKSDGRFPRKPVMFNKSIQ